MIFKLIRSNGESGMLGYLSRSLRLPRWALVAAIALLAGGPRLSADEPAAALVKLQPGDHISIIGNTLAERMQHDGWLETYLHTRYPKHDLSVRNLGFSGDELTTRLRSAQFGSPDEWLTATGTDVVFAFFGFNESFAGEAGLPKFRADLEEFLKHTKNQKFNGKTAPRIVLFSPIAHENLHDRNLPDGSANNVRLESYTRAMAEVARNHQVPFVDLFHPTRDLYSRVKHHFTINGIHMTDLGNRALAQIIDGSLFGIRSSQVADLPYLDKLRQVIMEKNHLWFNRYRTVDGYSIFGGRADLRFVNGQTNREVCQREMEILDLMTANRDRRIWALAQGKDQAVDDSNIPPFVPVITNKPGKGPNGAHIFLDGEQAIKQMTVARGMQVNLFASEKDFPELAKPVQMAFDPQGRLWVAVWPTYPHWKPKEEMNDKLLILEDTDGDGKADKCTVFADHLHCPTGFEFYNGGVLVAQAPDLLFLKDTKGTGKADQRIRVVDGLDSADTHHTSNSFVLDPGGALYFQEGTFHRTQVETPYGPPVRLADAGVFRYVPRRQSFEVYVSYGFANPHGHVFDRWGQDIVVDGTGANPYHAPLFSGRIDFPQKHNRPPQVYQQRTRPCAGIEILSSKHFPPDNQGNLLVTNVIGFQGILQYKLEDRGASFAGKEMEPILSSTDPNFRPSDLKVGPDGAIYFTDWHNPIIGHMQHNLRDPSRDREHGRIYRVTAAGRPLSKQAKIAGAPIENLLELLKDPEDRVRYRARIELGARETEKVMPAVERWLAGLDQKDKDFEHHRLEALWLRQSHNRPDVALLDQVLASPDFHARAAATRVLCYVRDQVPGALGRLQKLAADPHPRVRLEAIRAASFFNESQALDVVLASEQESSDLYLDFVRGETLRALTPVIKQVIASGREIPFTTDGGRRSLLKNVATTELLKMPNSRPVLRELLTRRDLVDQARQDVVTRLAKLDNKTPAMVLVESITRTDSSDRRQDRDVLYDLVRVLTSLPPADLAGVRPELERLALDGRAPLTRELGFVALVAADGSIEAAWKTGQRSTRALRDLVYAMPFVRDPGLRAALYPKVEPLVQGLPAALAGKANAETTKAIRQGAIRALASVRGRETDAFKTLSALVRDKSDRAVAIQALARIPSALWPKDQARPLLDYLLSELRQVPTSERSSPSALETMQVAEALADLLPSAEAKQARAELGKIGVRIIRLATVPEQMLFDKERLAVEAGKPIVIFFENNDLMPHNVAIVQPGALEEVGTLAEETATRPGALERGYIPGSRKVMTASKLLQPRDTQRISWTAPTQPGIYPYVCTYPGHWRRMYGALYVVENLDEFQANPEAYLAKHPLPIADPMLKYNRPRTEWKLDEFAEALASPMTGKGLGARSFANGKQIFQVASCVVCHRMNGVGNEFGPDLTKLDPKNKPIDILHDMLEPSWRINEKYKTFLIELQTGKAVTGLVLAETGDAIKVVENPLTSAQPIEIKKSDIAERKALPTSLMPKGLLDKLNREEILDLVAFILAKGNASDPIYQGGHHH